MSIETELYSRLSSEPTIAAIVGSGGIWAVQAPEEWLPPLLVIRLEGRSHEHHMGAAAGLAESKITIDCYSTGVVELDDLANAVRENLDGFNGMMGSLRVKCSLEFEETQAFEIQDHPADVYRREMEFTFWHGESIPSPS